MGKLITSVGENCLRRRAILLYGIVKLIFYFLKYKNAIIEDITDPHLHLSEFTVAIGLVT